MRLNFSRIEKLIRKIKLVAMKLFLEMEFP